MFYHKTKEFYEGDWHMDQRSGRGMLLDASNEVYVGGWRNDHQEGLGKKKKAKETPYQDLYSY